MMHARIEPKFDTIRGRLLVAFLALFQPLGRGWARYFTWLKFKQTPQGTIASREENVTAAQHRGGVTNLNFWNETGVGREKLLEVIFQLLETEDWRYSADTGWKDWDVQIYGNQWWSVKLRTVTEYHGGPKCLTRVRLNYKPVPTTVLANVLALSVLLYRLILLHKTDTYLWGFYCVGLLYFYWRAYRLKSRVADLVIAAANQCGLTRVSGKKSKPAPPEPEKKAA
jgi:hypothetical protein